MNRNESKKTWDNEGNKSAWGDIEANQTNESKQNDPINMQSDNIANSNLTNVPMQNDDKGVALAGNNQW